METKPLKMTDERSGFNKLPIKERLKIRTGVEWKTVFSNDNLVVYAPIKEQNLHNIRLAHNKMTDWILTVNKAEVVRCKSLKPLYGDINRAMAGEYSKEGV